MSYESQLLFYAACVAAMMVGAWASKDHIVQKLALLLLAVWVGSNLALAAVGYGREPMLVPTLDGAVAAFVGYVGFVNRSRLALVIFALFGVLGAVHVVSFVTHRTDDYYYYLAKNAIFLAQVLMVGGQGAWMAIRSRPVPRGERFRAHSLSSR
jgi:hypothetical protein